MVASVAVLARPPAGAVSDWVTAGAPWDAETFAARLVAAYRARPRVETDADVLAQPALCVLDRQDAMYLHSWALARAEGRSFRAICAGRGWPRQSARDGRIRAARAIAAALNRRARARAP